MLYIYIYNLCCSTCCIEHSFYTIFIEFIYSKYWHISGMGFTRNAPGGGEGVDMYAHLRVFNKTGL